MKTDKNKLSSKLNLASCFRLVVIISWMCIGYTTHAQERTVSGVVTDQETGETLPGVTVLIKGTSTGTITDMDGNYKIQASNDKVLTFSFVGYETAEITVGAESVVNAGLRLSIEQLEEIVVVGYGEQQKEDVTGVVAEVKAKDFNQGAIVSPDNLIAGKVAGVQITPNSGEPGGQVSIRIRGGTSINASSQPLYVIDGMPISNTADNPGGFSSGRNPMNFLNPADIESMVVLKDASAAAIYGSRGANGVIIITTKKGKPGQSGKVTYNGYVSVAQMSNTIDVLNADQFRSVVIAKQADNIDRLGSSDTDWYDEITQTGIGQSHNLSFTGGSPNAGFAASIGYQNIEGIVKSSSTERTTLSLNYNQSFLDGSLKINANVKSSYAKDKYDPSVTGTAITFDPTQAIYDENSTWGGYFEYNSDLAPDNPVSSTNQVKDMGETVKNFGNVDITYNFPFLEGFSATFIGGYDLTFAERKKFQPMTLRSQSADSGEVRMAHTKKINPLINFLLKYKRDLPSINSSFDVTAGYEFQQFNAEYPSYRAWSLPTDAYGFYSANVANEFEANNSYESSRLIGFFGRVNYQFMSKYMMTATLRRDGSSKFGPENRWGWFPSLAVGWRVIDESFMAPLSNIFDDLKVRVSYGVTGNQDFDNWQYLATYTSGSSTAQYQFGDDYVTTLRPNGYDEYLKWEETTSWNYGIDFGLLKGRFTGSVEYYVKNTNDLLLSVAVPVGTNLTNQIIRNVGKIQNSGLELALSSYVVDKTNFTWNLSYNIALNDNKVLDLNGNTYAIGGITGGTGNNIQLTKEGESYQSFYVYKAILGEDGTPLSDDVDHNGDGEINAADIYEDTNGDEVVNSEDKRIYHRAAPRVIMGLSSMMNYKNFDFSFTVRSNIGNYVYNDIASNNGYYGAISGSGDWLQNVHTSVLETNYTEAQYFSDYYVENASFVRVDNVTLGYTINQLKGANIRVYGTVQNPLVLTKYSGLDPEVQGGIDNSPYPKARTFLMGLSIGF